jgi:TetR/AcrR family transcriptional regulator, transcriptional repressor for nem operon
MPKDGTATREKILDAAQALILDRGYAGTTVDHVLGEVGITKGAFFYHFKTKDDLAKSLLQRFADHDAQVYSETRARAERLSNDPLQQMLIYIGLFEEMFEGLTEPYPGCLFASYVYELQQFDDETRSLIKESFRKWRELLREKFDAIAERYPPRTTIDTAALADAFTVVLEGAFIASKALNEPTLIVEQLRLFKNYVELLFGASQRQRAAGRKGKDAAAA